MRESVSKGGYEVLIIKKNIAKRRVYLYGAAALFIGSIAVMSIVVGTRSLHERLVLATPVKSAQPVSDKVASDQPVAEATVVKGKATTSVPTTTGPSATSTPASDATPSPTPSESPSPVPSETPAPVPDPTPTPPVDPPQDPVTE